MKKSRKKLVKQIATQIAMTFMEQAVARPRRAPAKKPRAAAKAKPVATAAPAPAVLSRRPIRITPDILQRSKQNTRRPATAPTTTPFRLPDFPKSAIPDNDGMAKDENITNVNAFANSAWGNIANSAFVEGVTFLGYTYLAELAQRPEYRVISETIATEMTRKWIKLQVKGDTDKTRQIEELNEELDRLRVRDMFCKLCEVDGLVGRAHLYIDTGKTDDPAELKTPIGDGFDKMSEGKFAKGDFKRLAVVEPIWCYPASYNSNDPLKEDWYNPQGWFVQGKEVHVSRLLRFVGREVPDMLKPAYAFGGLAMSQMAKPYVDNWLGVRQSVADIVQAFSVFVLSTNMGADLSPQGNELFDRVDLFNNIRNNRGTMVLDKESEEFQNVAAPLGTLDALQAQAQEHMAAVSRIPLVKLLGISPHGLNGTAEPEIRVFYDSIHAFQEKFFTRHLRTVIAFAQINIWGKVDPDISFIYEPLWSLDEKGQAEVDKIKAETGQILIDDGTLHPEEERARIASDPDTPYPGLDVDDVPEPPADENTDGDIDAAGDDEDSEDDEDSGETRKAA